MTDRLLIRFAGLSGPVALLDSGDVHACFPKAIRGWSYGEAEDDGTPPILTLRRDDQGFLIDAPWLDKPLRRLDPIDAFCGFTAELTRRYAECNPPMLCLHGAAAEFAGRLVVFPTLYRSGKSLLTACLAAAGIRVFTDDVLPIGGAEDHGIAVGIAPRLRLPLPDDLSAEGREFIEQRRGPCGERYLYLDLAGEELASHGDSAPIGGFVLLEREDDAEPELLPAREGDVLRQVIWQNFSREDAAPVILERLQRLVANARLYHLRYARAEQAVALLKETFSHWPCAPRQPSPVPVRQTPRTANPKPSNNDRELAPGTYLRNHEITETKVDGEHFLADAEGAAIHHLNPVAAAVWNLLAEPIALDQVVDYLHEAFPDVERQTIADDVAALIGKLVAKRLVRGRPAAEGGL